MCVMDVHPGQHPSTMAQAMVHNLGTVMGDLDMFASLLKTQKRDEVAVDILTVRNRLADCYDTLLEGYVDRLTEEVHESAPAVFAGTTYANIRELVGEVVHQSIAEAQIYALRPASKEAELMEERLQAVAPHKHVFSPQPTKPAVDAVFDGETAPEG